MRTITCCMLALVATIFFCSLGYAQAAHAELFGRVLDPLELPVAGAEVQARNLSTGAVFNSKTNQVGRFHLLGLQPGEYSVSIVQPGFRSYRQSGIMLRLADRIQIDVRLEIGPQAESVEVHASAPVLQTATAEVSHTVNKAMVSSLPLDGRNFISLVTLSPGVALPGGGSVLPRINGSRPRTNEYLYDGISVLQPEPGQVVFFPILDGMQEFRVNVNAYSAEYGRSNGGTIMVSSKSGGNALHGTLFEYFRHEKLNARNLFVPSGTKSTFRRNQYGYAIGGPIQKDKTFFFTDWQGTRLRTGVTRISTIPTVAQRRGIFDTAITDPVTEQSFTTIPENRIDPVARKIVARYPLPTRAGIANNYTRTGVESTNQNQFDLRLDRSLAAEHRLFSRFSYFRDETIPVTPLPDGSGAIGSGVSGHATTRGDGVVVGHEWTLTTRMLNQARFGFTKRDLRQSSLQEGGIIVPGLPQNSFASVLPTFSVAGFQQIGPPSAANSNFTTSVTQYLDTFTFAQDRHTLKFGIDIRREALNVLNPPNPTGNFNFTASGTGNAVASLLLGYVNAFTIDIQNRTLQERAHIAEFFVADTWSISDRLSLDFGTRYTLNFPSTEKNGQGAVFNLQTQLLDFPRTARELECCNLGPRAGLAYKLSSSRVIRAGYGMIWFEQTGLTTPFTLPQFPFIQTVGQQSQDNLHPAFVLASGPTIQVTQPNPNSGLGQGVFSTDRNHGSGYSQQWNVTVQQTFGENWNMENGYRGSKNTNLGIPDPNINQLSNEYLLLGAALLHQVANPYFGHIPASSSLGGTTITRQQLLRPYPRFTNVALFRNNIGHSIYHAFAAKVERRLSNGLTMNFAYTWSKLLDNASQVFSQTLFTGPVLTNGIADANNLQLERDYSQGDIPHAFSAAWVYRIPRLWKFSGWEVSGFIRAQSGDRVPVSQATNSNSNLGFGAQRPNRVGNPNGFESRSVAQWFDRSAFSVAPQFTLGSSSRNPVRGPALQNVDLMLSKTFGLIEHVNLEIRAEVFNLTNTPPLNNPNGSFGAPAFGTITSSGAPRAFEFVTKIHF